MDIETIFPKYIDMGGHSIVIRRGKPYFRGNDILCNYYRPCGEWSCIIKYNNYNLF